MNPLCLRFGSTETLNVLCIGAHSDDIEIGCGGTVLHLTNSLPKINFYWVVFNAIGPRREEAVRGAELFTSGRTKEVVLKEYRDGFSLIVAPRSKISLKP